MKVDAWDRRWPVYSQANDRALPNVIVHRKCRGIRSNLCVRR